MMGRKVLVIGSGIAGLTAARHTREAGHEVLLVTKLGLSDGCTVRAQGGIAGVVFPDDTVASHVADTLVAGAGHCDLDAVQVLCEHGGEAVHDLARAGVAFDMDAQGQWSRGLEGAHSVARIVHAGGDASGARIHETLLAAARQEGVGMLEYRQLRDLTIRDGRVVGATFVHADVPTEVIESYEADAVILATGGYGALYPFTTNPDSATGDGVVIAARAGAQVKDLEFMQFHPTVLAVGEPFLISEAVRGEGARLVDGTGYAFMQDVHPLADLAPRDVVARAIAERVGHDSNGVYLDATHLGAEFLETRFPTIDAAIKSRGLDWSREPIPVRPGAHFAMGGVATDVQGRTTLPGLYAVGEVACTGVHGANRLASNSLLEGAVFGKRVVEALASDFAHGRMPRQPVSAPSQRNKMVTTAGQGSSQQGTPFTRDALRNFMWEKVGLIRTVRGLEQAQAQLHAWLQSSETRTPQDQSLLELATLVTQAAIDRPASIGSHFISPEPDPASQADVVHSTSPSTASVFAHTH